MTKWICDCCNPSCHLEVHEAGVPAPTDCPFRTALLHSGQSADTDWKVVAVRKASKPAKKKRVVKKSESTDAAKARSLLF